MALTLHGTVADNTAVLSRPNAKPLIINGGMAVAQRGTSVAAVGSTEGYITVDRFNFNANGSPSARFTVTQDSDVPTGYGFAKSSKLDCTTAQGSLGSDDFLTIEHRFEGQNLQLLNKGTSNAEYVTFAFWVKTNKTGNYIFEIRDIDNNRIITQTYAVSSANTWEKKVLSFVGDTAGALGNDNGHSLQVAWCLFAGTDFTSGTQRTSWASRTNADRFVNQGVNLADSTDNNFFITGVQMEVGQFDANSIAPFQHESFGDNLVRCQRYLYDPLRGSASFGALALGACLSTTACRAVLYAPVEMRTRPTIVTSGNLEVAGDNFSPAVTSITTSVRTGTQAMEIQFDVGSGLTSGEVAIIRRDNNDTAQFRLDADL